VCLLTRIGNVHVFAWVSLFQSTHANRHAHRTQRFNASPGWSKLYTDSMPYFVPLRRTSYMYPTDRAVRAAATSNKHKTMVRAASTCPVWSTHD
jgi:hypothetical protein